MSELFSSFIIKFIIRSRVNDRAQKVFEHGFFHVTHHVDDLKRAQNSLVREVSDHWSREKDHVQIPCRSIFLLASDL